MHVLFLPSWYPSNQNDIAGSFFREQALALASHGVKVGVLAPTLKSLRSPFSAVTSPRDVHFEDDDGVLTYRVSGLHLTPRAMPLTAKRFSKMTRTLYDVYLARQGRPDLFHVHAALPAGLAAVDLKGSEGIPFVLSEHSSAFARGKISESGVSLAREVAVHANERFTVSSTFSRQMETHLNLSNGLFDTMPNMVDGTFLDGDLTPPDLHRFSFLHISLLNENKNIGSLLQAFADRFRDQLDVTLTIGGDGPCKPALMAQSRALGIADQTTFLGKLSRAEVRNAIAESQAFVLPSRFETFGVVLVEALAMGVPLIATRCGGPEDIVTQDNGILVPADDTVALANAMETIQKNRTQFDPQTLRNDCRTRFGPEALSRRWVSIYETVLAYERART